MLGRVDRIIGWMVATKTALEVPADPVWRHVIAATLLAAVRAAQPQGPPGEGPKELSEMGDLSLLLDRALDDIDGLAGVTTLLVEVEYDSDSALVTVAGSGDEIEGLAIETPHPAALADLLTGSSFEWNQTAISCSFRVPVR